GARRAGYRMVFQIVHDFGHGENDDGPAPDLVVHNMLDLIPVLEGELSRPNNGPGIQDRGGVRAILFDAGDLLYFRPQEGRRLQSFVESLGISMPQDFQARAEDLKSRAFCGEISQETYYETLVRFCGVQDRRAIDEGKRILREEGDDVRFFDGVRETLTRLKQRGFLLAIVTDTAQPVWAKLGWFEAEGIGHLWDAFVSSREVGFRKPDPRIYHAALRQLGVQPCEAVFVGHKATELDGARAVGLTTIAFNRDADAEGDISIEHFSELSELPLLTASSR
ncbi:MAG TPA: HAD family hydrolase, partial [Anaerolineae bacterium]|nr:HAD family hydrolase [Anaerolineae bacterium]